MLATLTSSPHLRLCWLVLPPECVFDNSEAWPFFHVQAGAFLPFKVGDHIFRLDNPLCKDADADGQRRARKALNGDLQMLHSQICHQYGITPTERIRFHAGAAQGMLLENRRKIPNAWLMRDIRRLFLWPAVVHVSPVSGA